MNRKRVRVRTLRRLSDQTEVLKSQFTILRFISNDGLKFVGPLPLYHAKLLIVLKDFLALLFRLTPRSVRLFLTRFGHVRFIVSAGAVIVDQQGQVLLLKHVFRAGSGWGIPGGFIDADEQPEAALRRELQEEVGPGTRQREDRLCQNFSTSTGRADFSLPTKGRGTPARPRGKERRLVSARRFAGRIVRRSTPLDNARAE